MKILMMLSLLMLTGCSCHHQKPMECAVTIKSADTIRPDILVIGDSISIAYTPHLQGLLPDYDVDHNECNAMYSANGVEHIDSWLNQRSQYDAITFNHGLWDAASWIHATDAEYRANLTAIAEKIKAKTSRPLFILTTEVLPGTEYRVDSRVVELNTIAVDVMGKEGIPILDLYSVSQSIRADHVSPTDVHYTDTGSEILAQAIADKLNTQYGIK